MKTQAIRLLATAALFLAAVAPAAAQSARSSVRVDGSSRRATGGPEE